MAKQSNTGIYQLPNGNWAYRFTQTVNGKRHNHKSVKDENGEPMRSQKAAIRARQLAIMAAEASRNEKPRRRVTVAEVYQEYCDKGRSGKAYTTIRKQDSLWRNHLSARFGARFIDTISVAEVNDYLSELYYTEDRAYRYVESFLKMFYLIFGQAYSRNYLNVDIYNKLCVNKDTRISMPKIRIDEEMVNNILIEVLGTIAEQERETIRKRQAEGIESAKAKGKKLGRPALTFPANWNEVYSVWKAGEITAKVAMERTNTKRTSFYKLVNMTENQ